MISRNAASIRAFSAVSSLTSLTAFPALTPPDMITRFKVRRLGIACVFPRTFALVPEVPSPIGHFLLYMGDRFQLCEFRHAGRLETQRSKVRK